MLAAVAGATVAYDKVKDAKDTSKEWMGRWWTAPMVLAHVGLQGLAYKMFGDNEKLLTHVVTAPTVAFVGAVVAGAVIDKLFHNHEIAEKFAMAAATGGIALGAAYVSLAANGHEGLTGMQPGDVMAAPVGEVVLAGSAATGAAMLGMGAGEAYHQDKPVGRKG